MPQAICVPSGVYVGATCAPFVLYIFGKPYFSIAPIAYPIAKLLDCILGQTNTILTELKTFLQFPQTGEALRADEFATLTLVLELNTKSVETIMTPLCVCPFVVGILSLIVLG